MKRSKIIITKDHDAALWFAVRYKRTLVGRGKFVKLHPCHYLLGEIEMGGSVVLLPRWLEQVFRIFNLRPKTNNFRGRGLGTQLLQKMLLEAKRRGVKFVTARAEPSDEAWRAKLLRWYQRFGFRLELGEDENKPLARIYLEL